MRFRTGNPRKIKYLNDTDKKKSRLISCLFSISIFENHTKWAKC